MPTEILVNVAVRFMMRATPSMVGGPVIPRGRHCVEHACEKFCLRGEAEQTSVVLPYHINMLLGQTHSYGHSGPKVDLLIMAKAVSRFLGERPG